jgi:hypothetical protein
VSGRHERRPRPARAPQRHLRPVPPAVPVTPTRATRVAGRRASPVGRVVRQARERWAQVAAAATGQAPGAAAGPRHLAGARRPPESGPLGGTRRVPAGRARRASWHEDAMTGWCSLLLVLGLYLGGWNQQRPGADGPSLTPWHGVLYLGFAVTAGWVLTRHQRRGAWSWQAVPPGYRLGLVGTVLALGALAGEVVWSLLHDGRLPDRAVSPFQLLLVCGASLLVSSALRAAWSGPTSARVPGLRAFSPVLLSSTLVVAVAAHVVQDVAPPVAWHRTAPAAAAADVAGADALAGLLLHNLLFVAPVLVLLRRWRTPLGTFTVMAGSVALLLATQTGFALVGLAGAAVLGGAAADVAVRLLRPSPQRPRAVWSVAAVAAAVYWTAHYGLLRFGYGVGWVPEVWLGRVAWAVLSGFALALLAWPPAVPLTAWNRGRARARAPATATATGIPARMVGR